MPCPICERVMCDHTPDERGQTYEEMMAEYGRDGERARAGQFQAGSKTKPKPRSPSADIVEKPKMPEVTASFPVWMTIKIGGMAKGQLYRAVEASGCRINADATDILERRTFKTFPRPSTIRLARIKARDLGFDVNRMPSTPKILEIIRRMKGICPAETGAQLARHLAERGMTTNGCIRVVSERIEGGNCDVLGVTDGDGSLWLVGGYIGPDGIWDLDQEIVFVQE